MQGSDASEQAPAVGAVLDDDERRELESLRREMAQLRAAPPPPPRRRRVRWASVAAAVLLILGCVGVPASVVAIWTHNQVADTDTFVATVGPLIEDPAVQAALTDRVSTEVLTLVDVQKLADDGVDALAALGVPPELVDRLRGFTGPFADAVGERVRYRVGQLVASPQFATAWNRALQFSHEQATKVLSGQAAAISVQGGMTVLDLAPFIDAAKQHLVDSGLTAAARIPEVHPTIDLFPASVLVRAQTGYQLLDAVATWLPWITVLLLATGAYLAKERRRAVLAIGLGVVAGMFVLAAGLLIARGLLVGAVPEQGVAAAASGFDLLVRFLRTTLRALAVLGLVVALGAYLAGPSTAAVQVRSGLRRGIGAMRRGRAAHALASGPVGPWVHAHRVLLRLLALGLAVLVFLLMDRPTGVDVLLLATGLVVVLGVIEFLDQVPDTPATAMPTGDGVPDRASAAVPTGDDGVPDRPSAAVPTGAGVPDQVPEQPVLAASPAAGIRDQRAAPPAATGSTAPEP